MSVCLVNTAGCHHSSAHSQCCNYSGVHLVNKDPPVLFLSINGIARAAPRYFSPCILCISNYVLAAATRLC
jgi:hypothetical protein